MAEMKLWVRTHSSGSRGGPFLPLLASGGFWLPCLCITPSLSLSSHGLLPLYDSLSLPLFYLLLLHWGLNSEPLLTRQVFYYLSLVPQPSLSYDTSHTCI
jgi:hypothetical protein